MATVDFSLDDIRHILLSDVKQMIHAEMDERFIKEREYTRQLVREEVREEVGQQLQAQFMTFIEGTFDPAISSLQDQINEVKHDLNETKQEIGEMKQEISEIKHEIRGHRLITNQHSQDIMELRAKVA